LRPALRALTRIGTSVPGNESAPQHSTTATWQAGTQRPQPFRARQAAGGGSATVRRAGARSLLSPFAFPLSASADADTDAEGKKARSHEEKRPTDGAAPGEREEFFDSFFPSFSHLSAGRPVIIAVICSSAALLD